MDRIDRKRLLKILAYLIFFILIVHFAANKFYWYYSLWYLDVIMHFLGGIWIGILYFYIFPSKESSLNAVFKMLFFILAIGIGWEMFEMLVNDVIAKNPFDYLDTFSDIFFDLFGGLCAILYLHPWRKKPS
ncbi:hypothetical protein A3H53_04735 [Candidatus Nomurabacteria bacterium RIFCSPLOWO2_02_FULL_40_10]|uniref:VanZ-like domain-containing protein n=2 Tax=Candidatus Nomuraibacteriota TaxID=1752729 RepID=A0A1F6XY67_9BACT|nr:MAG: hypothetical protein A2642_00710 [Candidatus Nomurabacteria bacterium RIFCSPHIGHO2_01_FULL_39_10]OGI99031.1 MAG: hypothetical protein A3H53_04735 [Candidatus Nomurabacteria bacterium RIFCSPLOWO2_02_FULL_40_10]